MFLENNNKFEFKLIYLLNLFFLFVACYLIATLYGSMFDNNMYLKVGMIIFIVAIDIVALWTFVLGKFYFVRGKNFYKKQRNGKVKIRWDKVKDKFIATGCFLIYFFYISVFAIPSAISFFGAELDVKEQELAQVKTDISTYNAEIIEQEAILTALRNRYKVEIETGLLKKFDKTKAEVENQEVKVANLRKLRDDSNNQSSKNAAIIVKSLASLSDYTGIQIKDLKKNMFSVSVFMLFLFLMITSYTIPQETKSKSNVKIPEETETEEIEEDIEVLNMVQNQLAAVR
jgi:hypothetical protein